MSNILHFVLALAVVAVLALLVSRDRKSIRLRFIVQLLVIEVLLAYFFLNSSIGLGFVVMGGAYLICGVIPALFIKEKLYDPQKS